MGTMKNQGLRRIGRVPKSSRHVWYIAANSTITAKMNDTSGKNVCWNGSMAVPRTMAAALATQPYRTPEGAGADVSVAIASAQEKQHVGNACQNGKGCHRRRQCARSRECRL